LAIDSENFKQHILIAEDEDGVALYMAALFRRAGFSVSIVDSAEKAYEYIQHVTNEPDENIDLLVTDVHMAGMTGLDLVDKLKEEDISIPTIIVTASDERDIVLEALRKGCYEFIEKPLKDADVLNRVTSTFDKIAAEKAKHPNMGQGMNKEIPNYRLKEAIGDGTSGTVFLAERIDNKKEYAIKVLKIGTFDNDTRDLYMKRFVNEGFAISQLHHPNIIEFFEFGYTGTGEDRSPYIVMEYFKGHSLNRYMGKKCTLTEAQRIKIIRRIAMALQFIHSKNMLHRDVKPGNILIDEKLNIKLTDFGVCSVPSSSLTLQFEVLGSPGYVAPEYWQSGKANKLVDIYSLGVLAYELFLGISPFTGDSLQKLRRNIIVEYPHAPRKVNPDFPEELQDIIAKMMKKNAKYRYQDAAEIIADLDLYEESRYKRGVWYKFKKKFEGKDWK
jgi:serine/threonine protein kinase